MQQIKAQEPFCLREPRSTLIEFIDFKFKLDDTQKAVTISRS